jgi:hypothetical protein
MKTTAEWLVEQFNTTINQKPTFLCFITNLKF